MTLVLLGDATRGSTWPPFSRDATLQRTPLDPFPSTHWSNRELIFDEFFQFLLAESIFVPLFARVLVESGNQEADSLV